MVLQPHVRKRTAVLGAWKKSEMLQKKTGAKMELVNLVQIWFSDIFYGNVWNDDISDIHGIFWCRVTAKGNKTILDF